jgi:sRNA-binding regulator protein Hfq
MNKRTIRVPIESVSATDTAHASVALLDPPAAIEVQPGSIAPMRRSRTALPPNAARRFSALSHDEHASNHQAELFYLQKQIQLQTQMVFVLEDGARVQGVVEWYDRNSIKVRGKSRVLIYKSAIKYLFKAGEVGTAPEA